MARHKHADLIHAWAEGATIQGRPDADTEWLRGVNPGWYEDWEYRVEPRTIKREGWVNIYRAHGCEMPSAATVHVTEDLAKAYASIGLVTTVKVEWEESL